MKTQVAIIGAGPAGLLLAQLLKCAGIESIVVESRSRAYIENRIRAGVIEAGTVDILREAGVADGALGEGIVHEGTALRFEGRTHRLDLMDLVGRGITIYPQHKLVGDLVSARLAAGDPILFETPVVELNDITSDTPTITVERDGARETIACRFVVGADGFHGPSRQALPSGDLRIWDQDYPYKWLALMAETPPPSHELIYSAHERGFTLMSMRSPTVSRIYIQVPMNVDAEAWSDDQVWSELDLRLRDGEPVPLREGAITQRSTIHLRSFVAAPMRHGSVFLAGDAAHIVPPTGAKGLNLAAADVAVLGDALKRYFGNGDRSGIDGYSDRCLRRVWQVQRFSAWITHALHVSDNPFEQALNLASLRHIVENRHAAVSFADNYTGLPLN
ncbi:4-hydroxybenzoate 3-monooxygenase [Bosea sp. 685]|uniref:4-hydroxybenzoate 3-monooxygenase n=1 Tax=Bosea sp. 685 TaxID=3080057 RepID=UPI002892BF8C|nr:4-hydroxybenzoate 3-monooxygenase [Bosea sp. 685]WNJ88049.1 4-hydroxybenzoate 3-monooxygenase [Bosea sp. 685]